MTNPVQYHNPLPKCTKKYLDYDLQQLNEVPLSYAASAYRGQGTSKPIGYSEHLLSRDILQANKRFLPQKYASYLLSWDVPNYRMSLSSIDGASFSKLRRHWKNNPENSFIVKNTKCLYQPLSVTYYSKVNFSVLYTALFMLPFLMLIEPEYDLPFVFTFIFSLCAIVFLMVIRLIIKNAGDTNTPLHKFDRATGLVYIISEYHTSVHKFSDIIPLFSSGADKHLHLKLNERESINTANATPEHWEFLKQFMDVTLPLPDIPELEPLRAYDKTTIAWDKKNKRPPDFYKHMTIACYNKLEEREKEYRYHATTKGSDMIDNMEKTWTLVPSELLGFEANLWPVAEIELSSYYSND